jgi:hypothetical protein
MTLKAISCQLSSIKTCFERVNRISTSWVMCLKDDLRT